MSSEGASSQVKSAQMKDGAGSMDSDKTKDIRTNNIIAAKGIHRNKIVKINV